MNLGGRVDHSNVMNRVGNSKIPPSGHLFFSTNIRNENKTREIKHYQGL
jgi:hypothetical protein